MHDPCIHAAYAHARPCRLRGGAHMARDAPAERHPRYVVARGVPARLEPHSSPLGLALVHMHTRVHAHPGVRASRASRQACSHLGRRRGGERAARRTRLQCGTHGGGVAMPWGARSLRGCGARAPRRRQSSAGRCCTARRGGVPPCLNHACASFAPSAPLSNPRHPLAPLSSPLGTPCASAGGARTAVCYARPHSLTSRCCSASVAAPRAACSTLGAPRRTSDAPTARTRRARRRTGGRRASHAVLAAGWHAPRRSRWRDATLCAARAARCCGSWRAGARAPPRAAHPAR